eukprot:CAMPEP_0115074062 /NCGR_PEP_ID=MMETSP0227-20121206/15139_1 /TAXON_ID=89957 /ORGANISM="Polarella glacialis, Strain CCMP 1383" /LENGTH=164 /DNA_ID=CAMNT_0002461003 /DNA_START=66 /DNA_END=557 /DNA_ORIENTATION=+
MARGRRWGVVLAAIVYVWSSPLFILPVHREIRVARGAARQQAATKAADTQGVALKEGKAKQGVAMKEEVPPEVRPVVGSQPWQHALSLLQDMQSRRLRLSEINVGSAVQACLAVKNSTGPSLRWQQALGLFKTAAQKGVIPDPACCGSLLAECEQRDLAGVEVD